MTRLDAIERMGYRSILQNIKWKPANIWQNMENIIFKYDGNTGILRFNVQKDHPYKDIQLSFVIDSTVIFGSLDD